MKLIVEIDLPNVTVEEFAKNKEAWFPIAGRADLVSVDCAGYLKTDPTDDSFKVFKLVQVLP